MAATQLSTVNRVLRRLRENTVSSVADTEYSILIADFLNQIIEEVGSAHNWSIDRRDVGVFITGGGSALGSAGLTDGNSNLIGEGIKSDRAVPAVDENNFPICYAGFELTSLKQIPKYQAPEVYYRNINEYSFGGGTLVTDDPQWFTYTQTTNSWQLLWFPRVDTSTRDFYVLSSWYDPQDILEVDGTDDGVTLRYNDQLMYLGTLWLALNERGEELGEPGNMAENQYRLALEQAIYNDAYTTQQISNNLDWRRD